MDIKMLSESKKLLLPSSSGSETEEYVSPHPVRRTQAVVLSLHRKWGYPGFSLDSNRRKYQIFGAFVVLAFTTYLVLLSNNILFPDNLSRNVVVAFSPQPPKVKISSKAPPFDKNFSSEEHVNNTPTLNQKLIPSDSTSSSHPLSKQNPSTPPSNTTTPTTTPTKGKNSTIQKGIPTTPPSDADHRNASFLTGCKLPKLNPWDPSIIKIAQERNPEEKCRKSFDLIFKLETNSSNGANFLVLVKQPEASGWKECCYNLVFRNSSESDNEEKFSEECYPIPGNARDSQEIPPDHEFLAIFCNSTQNASLTHVMLDGFVQAPLKPVVEERISKFYKESKEKESEKVNLVVLGIDAVSHMNFQRIMPKVHQHLIHNLEALWLDGYTKVGDNTHPNVLAMLGNQTANESLEGCSKNEYFDSCPLIFKHFSSHGYRTSFGEDSPWMGAFNYVKNGFMTPPTDYYLRPMARVVEDKIKSDKHGNSYICYGPRLAFQFLLDYIKALATSMGDTRRYSQFIWATSLTHDYANMGRMGESYLMEFLLWMEDKGHFNHTVLVLNSDHGIRWGPMRATPQGKIEENMPFIYFLFPTWFKNKYPKAVENLANNRNLLTSPWDTYATFLDLSELGRIENKEIKKRTKALEKTIAKNRVSRGISLFLPIPTQRNCEDASIPEHYCVCHPTQTLPPGDPGVQQAANYAVFALNSKISRNYSQCAYLTLGAVGSALQINNTDGGVAGGKGGVKTLDISFSTLPGNGNFDATLIRDDKKKEWRVSGQISRTNLYGNQSYCVDNSDMKKYCYCLPS